MKKAFVVGRSNKKSRRLWILEFVKSPIAGPFSLTGFVARA
jgi:hypothetical protein